MKTQTKKSDSNPSRRGIFSAVVKWWPVFLISLFIAVLGHFVGLKKEEVKAEKSAALREGPPPVNVVTMRLVPNSIRDRINLPGVVEPWIDLTVSAEVAGAVVEKTVSEGVYVKKGDTLALIDSGKYRNAFNAAKASYESALANKKRLEKLYRSQLSRKADLDDLTAAVANHKAQMEIAAIDLEKCTVKAPIAGRINNVHIEKGQFIDTGNPVARIIVSDPVKVRVGIPESDVNAVRKLDTFEVKIDALEGMVFTASKHFLSSRTSTLARLYDLDLRIANPDGVILPDMFARVEIVKKQVDEAISVPLYAIVPIRGRDNVFVAKEGEACSREVETGLQEGWMVEITKGIAAGDQVIVVGQRSVSDKRKINVIRTANGQEELER